MPPRPPRIPARLSVRTYTQECAKGTFLHNSALPPRVGFVFHIESGDQTSQKMAAAAAGARSGRLWVNQPARFTNGDRVARGCGQGILLWPILAPGVPDFRRSLPFSWAAIVDVVRLWQRVAFRLLGAPNAGNTRQTAPRRNILQAPDGLIRIVFFF